MQPSIQYDSNSAKLRRMSELFISITQAPFGAVKKKDLDEYDKLANDYIKDHESLKRSYPDPNMQRTKFDAFIRRQASDILKRSKSED